MGHYLKKPGMGRVCSMNGADEEHETGTLS